MEMCLCSGPSLRGKGKQRRNTVKTKLYLPFIQQIFIEHLLLVRHHSWHEEYSSEHDGQVSGAHTKILKSHGGKHLKSSQAHSTPQTCPSMPASTLNHPRQGHWSTLNIFSGRELAPPQAEAGSRNLQMATMRKLAVLTPAAEAEPKAREATEH